MRWLTIAAFGTALLCACGKEEAKPEARPPIDVTAIKIVPQDASVTFEYVGQTESSHQVQIVARVSGFLDKRVYVEWELGQGRRRHVSAGSQALPGAAHRLQGRARRATSATAGCQRQSRAGPTTGGAQRTFAKGPRRRHWAAAGRGSGRRNREGKRRAGGAQSLLYDHYHADHRPLQLCARTGRSVPEAVLVPVPIREFNGNFPDLFAEGVKKLIATRWTREGLGDLAVPVVIRLILASLIWLWPNWLYWKKRAILFS